MKKARYRISAEALSDLEKIWTHTRYRWSKTQADRYYALLMDEIDFLSRNFFAGKSVEHVRKGYRAAIVKSHVIFYRISGDQKIEVMRILHQRMDIDERLG